jgi:hypothetical protein
MRSVMLRALVLASTVVLLVVVALPGVASAEVVFGGPGWAPPVSRVYPTNLPPKNPASALDPEGKGTIDVDVVNDGGRASEGPITVTDVLPRGVTATEAGEGFYWECTIAPGTEANSVVTCHNSSAMPSIGGGGGRPTGSAGAEPNREVTVRIEVQVAEGAPEGPRTNHVRIEGGGAPPAVSDYPILVSSTPAKFGFRGWDAWFSNADGSIDTQAGSTPYAWTTNLDFSTTVDHEGHPLEVGDPRNVAVKLPRGLIGNPTAVPRCSRGLFAAEECPTTSEVGILTARLAGTLGEQPRTVYNLVPPPGVAVELGAIVRGLSVFFDAGVRTGEGYGAIVHVRNIPILEIIGSVLTLWGVPGDASHDTWRTNGNPGGCTPEETRNGIGQCETIGPHPQLRPFLRLPTSCGDAQPYTIEGEGWEGVNAEAATFESHDAEGNKAGFTGCGALPFSPSITLTPESSAADTPTGLHVDLHIPQPENVRPVVGLERPLGAETGLAEADLKDAVVTLPKGVTVNPSSANGLAACTAGQIGLTSPAGASPGTYTSSAAQCPAASKIGSVEVHTPLLDHPLKGAVYVAQPHENEFGSLLAIYIAVDDPETGVVVKLAGHVEPDGVTGQLKTRFDENPQLPFEDFKLDFFGGPAAALRTPPTCGGYLSTTDMTPWSSPAGADANPQSSFNVSSGPGGAACANSEAEEPNTPSFEAGTQTPLASGFSPFTLKLTRGDGSQNLKGINAMLPPGLVGDVTGIPYCPQASLEAAEHKSGREEQQNPSCPTASELGTVTVGAGAGPAPYYATGHAYLAGPYKGAPFDLVVITPAVAGPYDLGTVVVRTALYVNPETAQVHAISDPLPSILQGIPLDVRSITLNMSRPNFMLNPSNCNPMSITGEALTTLNQTATLTNHFQVGGCAGLKFAPDFKVTTSAKTSRANGASLTAKILYPPFTPGYYTNIASAKVDLPKQLPSRLTTLHNACPAAVFEANPALCPPKAIVGQARVITPLLPVPLTGPAYFVSHGNEAFPALTMVLQGDNVTVELVGSTFIKKGITSNTFKSTPDVPVNLFELTLPSGPNSALGSTANFCTTKLLMPTKFIAQNGTVLKQTTKISVTGCPKAKHARKTTKHKHKTQKKHK